MKKLINVLGKSGLGRVSVKEYQANLNGLNMFFGAVLGFVLVGTMELSDFEFGMVLFILASAVISILFISSSRYRVAYSILALLLAGFVPEIIDTALKGDGLVPGKIRPTLLVWTLMAILGEFSAPKKKEDTGD